MIQKTTYVLCEVWTEAEETYEHKAYNKEHSQMVALW
jgi:hypothetical protein